MKIQTINIEMIVETDYSEKQITDFLEDVLKKDYQGTEWQTKWVVAKVLEYKPLK